MATSIFHREWANLFEGTFVEASTFLPSADEILSSITLKVDFALRNIRLDSRMELDYDEFCAFIHAQFRDGVFTEGQKIPVLYKSSKLLLDVCSVEASDLLASYTENACSNSNSSSTKRGILTDHSLILLTSPAGSLVEIKGGSASMLASRTQNTLLLQPNFKFEDLGIGGLEDEFKSIFRRAFASRIFPAALVDKLGISHVKGIILHGPPGTGKTLMARQIGKMLNSHEPKKVNGPEILNKYVGQSEENIRNLFKDAELEFKERGDASQLHIIIFDEIDAICKQRGSRSDSTGVGDTVVNQLLAKLDGVDQLNNILVIGMTNRLDMIDDALLRPGRFEVHIEIGLPDEHGRLEILRIHTQKMRENSILDHGVELAVLAEKTKNFSGAEISGLVKSAASFAFNRHVKVGTIASVSDNVEDLKVGMQDFEAALEEVHAAFGRSEEEFEDCAPYGLIPFGGTVDEILHLGRLMAGQLRGASGKNTRIHSLLLYGMPASGKTSLAAEIAKASAFPYMKMISPQNLVGLSELGKVTFINKIFNDAYKSPLSVIVVDCVEKVLEYVPLGPRYSNVIYQSLSVLIGKVPPKGHKLFVITTTSNRGLMNDLDLISLFDREIMVHPVESWESLERILKEFSLFSSGELQVLHAKIAQYRLVLEVGVKKIINFVELAMEESEIDRVDVFFELLLSCCTIDQ